jgi:FkbM family methyltransferase
MTPEERLGEIVMAYRENFGDVAPVIYDAGTRDGDDASYLAKMLSADTVVCFDANPLAVNDTKNNYPEFMVIETALSDYDGEGVFTQIVSEREDYAGSSSLTNVREWPDAELNQIPVKVSRMDTLIESLELPIPDIIKVDLEGYSYEFLQGLGKYLHEVKVLHLETETFERHEGHKDNRAVAEFMEANGFRLVFLSYEWGPSIEDQTWVNCQGVE